MTEQEIIGASKAELKEQAELLGLEFDGRAGIADLRKKVADALGITLPSVEVEVKPSSKTGEDRIWLKIDKSETDKLPVPIVVNGYTIVVKRGVWVHVKREFVKVLQNAVSIQVDGETGEMREMHSYPFQFSEAKPPETRLGQL